MVGYRRGLRLLSLTVKIECCERLRHKGTINRDVMQVYADAVILCISIEEHAELEQWVRGVLNTRYHTAWRKGGLFYVSVKILRVFIQHKLAKLLRRKLLSRLGLSNVKWIKA